MWTYVPMWFNPNQIHQIERNKKDQIIFLLNNLKSVDYLYI